MPTYEHFCPQCETITEDFCPVADRKQFIPCAQCGASAERIISASSVRGDEMPAWMRHPETLGCLQNAGAKNKITTRGEYNRYLKQNNIAEISARREV